MSASPAQFERLARDLYERGHNVLVPRLPHHGHADRLRPRSSVCTPTNCYDAVDEYVAIARELGERVTVAGFSLGGLLAAWTAQHYDVDRALPIAPFFGISWIPNRLMGPRCRTVAARARTGFIGGIRSCASARCQHDGLSALRDARDRARLSHRAVACSTKRATNRPAAEQVTIVTNATEVAVNNYAIRRLYEHWHAHDPTRSNSRSSPACRSRTTSSPRCARGASPIACTRTCCTRSIPSASRCKSPKRMDGRRPERGKSPDGMPGKRCSWATTPALIEYHDAEWGVPLHDDSRLFELLILEGAQAGLSWATVLRKRARYRELFRGFDPLAVSRMRPATLEKLAHDPGIIRNRAKILSAVGNARALLRVRAEFISFDGISGGSSAASRSSIADARPARFRP